MSDSPAEKPLGLKDLASLLWRTWPYLKPQLPHLALWMGLTWAIEIVVVTVSLLTFDLLNNKILLGVKLEPAQATLLQLDESFIGDAPGEVTTDIDATELTPEPLTTDQRRTLRNHFLILFGTVSIFLRW